jgi:hypothetical protein
MMDGNQLLLGFWVVVEWHFYKRYKSAIVEVFGFKGGLVEFSLRNTATLRMLDYTGRNSKLCRCIHVAAWRIDLRNLMASYHQYTFEAKYLWFGAFMPSFKLTSIFLHPWQVVAGSFHAHRVRRAMKGFWCTLITSFLAWSFITISC